MSSEIPAGLYFNRVRSLESKYNRQFANDSENAGYRTITLAELLKDDKLVRTIHFCYVVDIDWMMQQYPVEAKNNSILLIHGYRDEQQKALEEISSKYPMLTLCRVNTVMYGVHHTKMTVLIYEHGMRLVIGSCNLLREHWELKVQTMYVSDLFPKKQPEMMNDFQEYFIKYLKAYKLTKVEEFAQEMLNYDMSSETVSLVGSIPGQHKGSEISQWGHLRLKKLLTEKVQGKIDDIIITQASSIGSLGNTSSKWFMGELYDSLKRTIN